MNKKHEKMMIALVASLFLWMELAQAQTVLKTEPQDNGTTLYVDGGPLGGAGAQNNSRIVRVEQWACPAGTTRPASGSVMFVGPPRWQPKTISLGPRQCLHRVIDPDTGAETDDLVDMVKQPDNGGHYITAGKEGDQVDSRTSTSNTNATAASAAGAAAAGYFNSCSGTAFSLLSDPVPNPKKNPAEYRCYKDYEAHAH